MKRQTFASSVLREEWDHDTRTYRRFDATGVQVEQRPYVADEHAEADASVAAAQVTANEATVTGALGGSQVFDALRQVAAGTGTFATAAARDAAIRTCARALVLLVRLQLRRLDAAD